MRFLIIKAIFLLLMNVGTITYSVSANSVDLPGVNTVQPPPKNNLIESQSLEILNLTKYENDYLHNMAKYAESKIANKNYRTLGILYPVGELLSYEDPLNNPTGFTGPTHKVAINFEQKKEIITKLANFLAAADCNNDLKLSFDRKIQAGTGNIIINNSDGRTIETIDVNSRNITFSGTKVNIHNASKFIVNSDPDEHSASLNVFFPSGSITGMDNVAFGDFSFSGWVNLTDNTQKKLIREVLWWLDAGGGNAGTYSIPGCENRFWIQAVDNDAENARLQEEIESGRECGCGTHFQSPKAQLQRIFFHEAYHSYQKDLVDDCTGDNDDWVIEGTASYFSEEVVSWAHDNSEGLASDILQTALWDIDYYGTELKTRDHTRGSSSGTGIHMGNQGMAALRLMVELGWLDESRIKNASLFQDCARGREFQNDNPKIQFIKNHYHEIEKQNGVFQFKASALNPNS